MSPDFLHSVGTEVQGAGAGMWSLPSARNSLVSDPEFSCEWQAN